MPTPRTSFYSKRQLFHRVSSHSNSDCSGIRIRSSEISKAAPEKSRPELAASANWARRRGEGAGWNCAPLCLSAVFVPPRKISARGRASKAGACKGWNSRVSPRNGNRAAEPEKGGDDKKVKAASGQTEPAESDQRSESACAHPQSRDRLFPFRCTLSPTPGDSASFEYRYIRRVLLHFRRLMKDALGSSENM